MSEHIPLREVTVRVNNLATQILHLAQSSLTEHQFKAFRKLTLDYFANFQKSLGKDRCGQKQNKGEGGGVMDG